MITTSRVAMQQHTFHSSGGGRHQGMRDALATFPIVALWYVGYVKDWPALAGVPVDLTVLAFATLTLVTLVHLVRNQWLPRGLSLFVIMIGVFLFGVWGMPSNAYAATKVELLFLLTLPSAIMGAVLVSTPQRAWWLARWVVIIAFALGVLSLLPSQTLASAEMYGRIAIGGDTIASGRVYGAAAVSAVALGIGHIWRWRIAMPAALVFAMLVLGSGSRGPILAGAVGIFAMIGVQSGVRKLKLLGVVSGLVALIAPWAIGKTNEAALDRILLLFSDDQGESVRVRDHLYEIVYERAAENPSGGGWGYVASLDAEMRYPHNLLLEVFAEGGWLAGILLLVVGIVSFVRSWNGAKHPAGGVVLGLLVFWTFNAMVSGDLNSNRATFTLLAIGLTFPITLSRSCST